MGAVPDPEAKLGRPWLLAIDTATPQAGVALTDGHELAVTSWPGGRRQSTTVPAACRDLLERAGISLAQVGAIAVTTGPGSFTGLRVGLSLAKGLALVPPRDLVGVATLDAVAAPLLSLGRSAIAVIPAGRGRVVWATGDAGGLGAPSNASFAEFVEAAARIESAMVIGELDPGQREALANAGLDIAPPALGLDRAGWLAGIGYERWRRGQTADPASLQPVYLHGRPNPR